MPLPVWTRQPTTWHDPRRGFLTLPTGVNGCMVALDELPEREQRIFSKILHRSPDLVLVRLAGHVCALSKVKLLGVTSMIDATKFEQEAITATLAPLGEYVGSIGMHRPLADYSKQEVITMVEVIVTAYQHYFNTHDDIPFSSIGDAI
ncbi:MAG: hypothetical protein HQM06_13385 [Magnetococcales bacterium]|nr:hypothetical protein [Magnetococcales bacterium]